MHRRDAFGRPRLNSLAAFSDITISAIIPIFSQSHSGLAFLRVDHAVRVPTDHDWYDAVPRANWAAWHLPGGPVGPPARWAATSNV